VSALNTPGERKIVTFSLGEQMFGIDMRSLIEIREWETPTPLPSVPAYIKGLINLRGTIVPVVGLAERLGWKPSVLHARSCLLVVTIAGKQAGFLVDEVADIIMVNEDDIQPAPVSEISEENVIAGLVQVAPRSQEGAPTAESSAMVLLLDLDALSLTRHLELAA